jgi:hypothetical protein
VEGFDRRLAGRRIPAQSIYSEPQRYVGSRDQVVILTRLHPDCPTETQVRLDVRKDEEALTAAGATPLHGRSATAFLVAGIQIEDAQ